MKDKLLRRNAILDELVSIRSGLSRLACEHDERLASIGISLRDLSHILIMENAALLQAGGLVERFASLVGEFPALGKQEPRSKPLPKPQGRLGRWGFKAAGQTARPSADAALLAFNREVALQDARVAHIVGAVHDFLRDRRIALQHGSYHVKKVVVSLNQAAAYLPEGEDATALHRQRHHLEMVVAGIERHSTDLVVRCRKLAGLVDVHGRREDAAAGDEGEIEGFVVPPLQRAALAAPAV
jgi:hypothetical protein